MQSAIQHLLDIRAIQKVPDDQIRQGFLSYLSFPSPRGEGGRAILDLKRLNSYIQYRHFKMHSLNSILEEICEGELLTSVDLMEAYLPIL